MTKLGTTTCSLLALCLLTVVGDAAAATASSGAPLAPMGRGATSTPSPGASMSASSSSRGVQAQAATSATSPKSTISTAATTSPGRDAKTSSPDSRLYAPKQRGESDQAFFQRAAREIGQKSGAGGQMSPEGRAALTRLANGAGYNAIRSVITGGGVVGSASGNSYVTYYKSGWTGANLVGTRAPASSTTHTNSTIPAEWRTNAGLERNLRGLLAQSPTGRLAIARLDAAGITIRFRQGGGTMNDAATRSIVVDTKMGNGQNKPLTWLAVSVAHEATHAWDDKTKQTPSTVSPLGATYSQAKSQSQVPMSLRKDLVAERTNYVTRQVAGEARSMTTEARVRHELEGKGATFHKLDNKLVSTYSTAHNAVYHAAGVKPPAPGE